MSASVPCVATMRASFTSWLPKVWSPLPWVLNTVPIWRACGTALRMPSSISRVSLRSNSVSTSRRLLAVDDQAGIAVAPAAVRLQPGVAAVAEIVQALGELPLAQRLAPATHVICLQPDAVSPTCRRKRA